MLKRVYKENLLKLYTSYLKAVIFGLFRILMQLIGYKYFYCITQRISVRLSLDRYVPIIYKQ